MVSRQPKAIGTHKSREADDGKGHEGRRYYRAGQKTEPKGLIDTFISTDGAASPSRTCTTLMRPPKGECTQATNAEGCQIIGLIKNLKVMEQTNIQRDIDREEIKRIWQQLAIGTALALAGLVFMGIGEAICRWLEGM